jgi:hypothetical protein
MNRVTKGLFNGTVGCTCTVYHNRLLLYEPGLDYVADTVYNGSALFIITGQAAVHNGLREQ